MTVNAAQQSQPRARVYAVDGLVTINAQVFDPDVGDTVTYDWTGTDTALGAATVSSASFVLCPVTSCVGSTTIVPSGSYAITVKATDSHGASNTSHWTLFVASSKPALTSADTDLDGVSDATEGVIDSWNTGLPDYLNPFDDSYVMPDQVGSGLVTHALETEPGLTLHVGSKASSSGATGALLVTPPADASYTHVGGVFDFEIHGLQPGTTTSIVIPVESTVAAGAVYRQYAASAGWQNFSSMGGDNLSSAPAKNGVCPGPDSNTWTTGLSSGAQCIRVTLTDGGLNDADGVADGVITHLGGAAAVPVASSSSSSAASTGSRSGGGALSWPLLWALSVLTLMIYVRRRRIRER